MIVVTILYIIAGLIIAYAISEFFRFLVSIVLDIILRFLNDKQKQKEQPEKKEDD